MASTVRVPSVPKAHAASIPRAGMAARSHRRGTMEVAHSPAAFTRRGNARFLLTGVLKPAGFTHWGWEPAFGREVGTLVRGLAKKPSHLCDGVFTK